MEIKSKATLLWGGILIFLSIALGAMGAHALEKVFEPTQMNSYQTAVTYMMYQGLAFLVLSFFDRLLLKIPVLLMRLGVVLFSGSVFILLTLKAASISIPTLLVILTPVGGSLLLIGWLIFIVKLAK